MWFFLLLSSLPFLGRDWLTNRLLNLCKKKKKKKKQEKAMTSRKIRTLAVRDKHKQGETI